MRLSKKAGVEVMRHDCGLRICRSLGERRPRAQAKPANYKGLEITVAGVERARHVGLKDCPPGANSVRGLTKPGEEFAIVNLSFKVTPAFKETIVKKPVLLDAAARPSTPRCRSSIRRHA